MTLHPRSPNLGEVARAHHLETVLLCPIIQPNACVLFSASVDGQVVREIHLTRSSPSFPRPKPGVRINPSTTAREHQTVEDVGLRDEAVIECEPPHHFSQDKGAAEDDVLSSFWHPGRSRPFRRTSLYRGRRTIAPPRRRTARSDGSLPVIVGQAQVQAAKVDTVPASPTRRRVEGRSSKTGAATAARASSCRNRLDRGCFLGRRRRIVRRHRSVSRTQPRFMETTEISPALTSRSRSSHRRCRARGSAPCHGRSAVAPG